MRSGRGKCPQCKEQIVVDLDAEEIRCPYCNALLKKSAKSAAEVRAEKEKARAEREAVEAAAAAAAAAEVAAEEPAPAATVEPEVASVVTPEVAPAPVEAPAEPVDEIGLSDEELAMMDEVSPEERAAARQDQEAETEAPVDEIGISDEELAMMDDVPPTEKAEDAAANEEIPVEGAFTDEAPAAAPAATDDEPLVFGSIGAGAEDATPEEADAARIAAEENEPDSVEEDAAPVNNNITLEDDVDPALLDDELPAIANDEEDTSTHSGSLKAPAPAPVEEALVEEPTTLEFDTSLEAPAFGGVEETVEEPEETAEATEPQPAEGSSAAADEIPAEEIPAAEAPAEEEPYVPTEEDMAFAASLSNVGRSSNRVGFVAVENHPDEKEKKSKRKSKAASEGDNTMKGSSVYKKPIALIMTILSILAAAFWFLYYKASVIGLISVDLLATVAEKLPTFGGEMFSSYVIAGFAGLVALVSIFGLTGHNGKLGFLFILLADVVFALVNLFGATPIVEVEAIQKIVADYGEYAFYAIYGLLVLGAIFLAISFGRAHGEFSAGGAILPLIYLALVVAGYVVLIMMPKFMDGFTLSADLERYVILGAIGAALLLTFIGVHNGSLSRSVNAWLVFATVLAVALINFVPIIVEKFLSTEAAPLSAYAEIPYFLTPIIAIFAVAGFAASDMRN